MTSFLKRIVLSFYFFTCLKCEIIWPTNTGRKLSSNFGEFRDDHFHMGIDIKTNGKEGYEVYAIEDGFISRMVTNYTGYGKALYMKIKSEKTAVYCHLSKFSSELEKELIYRQSKDNAYHVNTYFDSTNFPFKKGDIIGYTGNTGASFGPHLHFELRSPKGNTLNPLRQGIFISDTIPPVLKGLTVFPLTQETLINGFPLPMEFSMIRNRNNLYSISDTIHCTRGRVGIAVSVEDKIQQNSNIYQFYKAEMFVDDSLVFDFTYDSISFFQTAQMKLIENREFGKAEGLSYHKLFLKENSLFLPNNELSGQILLSPGVHILHLSITDASGNVSIVNGKIFCELFNRKTQQKPRFWLRRKSWQTKSFFDSDLQILNSENGVFIEFQNPGNLSTVYGGLLMNNKKPFDFGFFHTPPQTYYSPLIPFEEFKNINSISVLTKEKLVEFPINSMVVYPNSQSIIRSKDSTVVIRFTESTLFDTALIWVENNRFFLKESIKPLANIYNIEPISLPLKNPAFLTFSLNQKQRSMSGLGIYKLNNKQDEWEFQALQQKNFNKITVELSDLGAVTLLQDTIPPEMVNIFPSPSESYTSGEIHSIECILKDNLSGIEPTEETLKIILNEKKIFCAYQPVKRKLSYSFVNPLPPGDYTIFIFAQDYAGNKMEKTIKFNVN